MSKVVVLKQIVDTHGNVSVHPKMRNSYLSTVIRRAPYINSVSAKKYFHTIHFYLVE